MSPGWGVHRFANSVVPGGARNRTPLGLLEKMSLESIYTQQGGVARWQVQFAFPLVLSYSSHYPRLTITEFLNMLREREIVGAWWVSESNLVLKIARRTPRLVRAVRVSEYDTLSAFFQYILKELLQMRYIFAHLLLRQLQKRPLLGPDSSLLYKAQRKNNEISVRVTQCYAILNT